MSKILMYCVSIFIFLTIQAVLVAPDDSGKNDNLEDELELEEDEPKPQPKPQPKKEVKKCFAPDTVVILSSGQEVAMVDLSLGDSVLVMGEDGTSHYEEFLGWLDKSLETDSAFLQIETDAGDKLKLTGNHALFAYKSGDVVPVFADSLVVGDLLVGSNVPVKNITSITRVVEKGYVDPLTYSGTIMANGIACSCYASFPHHLANLALLPARLAPSLLLDDEKTLDLDGTRGYVSFIKYVGGFFRQRNKVWDASWENSFVMGELWSLDYQRALSHVIELFY